MGLFNYVDIKMNCPYCKKKIDGFQTKEGILYCDTVPFWSVDNFYTNCKHCKKWVEYVYDEEKKKKRKLKDYIAIKNGRLMKK